MAIDREATLTKAEKFLRAGRLDAAIAEYARVLDDQPKDWTTANTLGDLYARAGQSKQAVVLYGRIAEHLFAEGFYPRAAALFKKILKIIPGDEQWQLRLAEASACQGLLADARTQFLAVEKRRRKRGDEAGADEIVARLATLDPDVIDATSAGAQASQTAGGADAPSRYAERFEEFIEEGRYDEGRQVVVEALSSGDATRESILAIGWTYRDSNPDAAVICVDVVTDALVGSGAFREAAAVLQECATRIPNRVPTLLRLVEVCVDGGLEETMFAAQAQLADAYLAGGRLEDARIIAEDLVNRDPSNPEHLARLRRSREALDATDTAPVITLSASLDEGESLDALLDLELPDVELGDRREDPVAPPLPRIKFSTVVPAPRESVEIDLSSLIGELKSPPAASIQPARPRDLDEVFADIRNEVAGDEASDSSADHLVLARSYLEMGMPAEAASALETAARSPHLRFTAATMLAEIRRDEGNLPEAIEWFERAAEAPPPGPEEGRALLYDLGDVLETVGETARALAVFLELDADAPEYRDVRERVMRLSRVETEG